MLPIRVLTESGREHVRVSSELLAELTARIGGHGDRFLVVTWIPDLPDDFIQVWHEQGGGYTLEHRDGSPERHFGTEVAEADPDAVARALVGWARREDGWDAGLSWTPADLGVPEPVPELDPEVEQRIEEYVRGLLRQGYDGRRRLAEAAEDWLVDGDTRPVSRPQAWRVVNRLWRERLDEQARWDGVTDPERITAVFATLDARGITARENFACCRGCGLSEIGAERTGPDKEAERGFVFFHTQCTESVAAGHGLTLHYGGFDDSETTTAAVGREVTAALAEAGLTVEWDGSPGTSILVEGLDWRKRLTG